MLDSIGSAHGTPTGQTFGEAGGLLSDAASTAATSTRTGSVLTTTPEAAPEAVTVEAWVKTTSTRGGRIIGFGDQSNTYDVSRVTDRVLYLDNSGRPNFMSSDGAQRTITSGTAVNDGNWHYVVGMVGNNGMELFVDGVRATRDGRYKAPTIRQGYWRLGSDLTTGFANRPADQALVGTIDEVAVTPRVLNAVEVRTHYQASGRSLSPAIPTDVYGKAVIADQPDIYWRLAETTAVLDYSGGGNLGNAAGTIDRRVAGAITGNTAATFDGTSAMVIAQQPWVNPGDVTVEIWFKTNTTKGGMLMGFGNTASGASGSHDRHVYMLNTGKLVFGAFPGSARSATSSLSYNDNQWHHAAATQGPDGMKLFVDGTLVATNAATTGHVYPAGGYWRVGGTAVWSGATSRYFAGTLDEAAVYPRALSEDSIRAHYAASGRTAANRAPVASISTTEDSLTVTADGSASSDPDGGALTHD